MSRFLQYFNFVGVLALAALCVLQWKDNSQMHQQIDSVTRSDQARAAKVADDEKAIKGFHSDLDDLHGKLTKSETALKDSQSKLAGETDRNKLLTAKGDQLEGTLKQWESAVKQRDDAIKAAFVQSKEADATRTEAVNKFNDLVARYNAMSKELDSARVQLNAARTAAAASH